MDGTVTAQLIGCPDSALAGDRVQGRWHRGGFFVWFYLMIFINRIEKLNDLGAFYRLVGPGWPCGVGMGLESGAPPGLPGIGMTKGEGPFGGICHWRLGAARV